MKLGAHIGISRGLVWTASEAIRLRLECIQIFLSNPRGWKPAAPDDDAVAAQWRAILAAHEIAPVVGHSSYLVNLASPAAALRRKSLTCAVAAIRRGIALGSDRFIIPAAYHMGAGEEAGRRLLAAGLRELADAAGPAMAILLENTTGAGSGMCWRFEDMAAALEAAGDPRNAGICLDACHLHVSGYDLGRPELVNQALEQFDRAVGLARLGAMHLNDARHAAGSRRDVHAHIGRGTIGCAGFGALMRDPRLAQVPGMIETPREGGWDARNLRLLRRLREQEKGSRK
jgi:deoxyribonuclease-4